MALKLVEGASPACLADVKTAMENGGKMTAELRKCLGAHQLDPERGREHGTKLGDHHLYRMGDTSLPVEIEIMRPRYGGPADHIEVHGDATVGEVKYPPNPQLKQMDDNYFRGFPAYDQLLNTQPAMWKGFLNSLGNMASPVAGLLGAYYMGWNEHGYNFDGEYAKKMNPTTGDVEIAEFGPEASQAVKQFKKQTEADGAIPEDYDAQLVASGVYYPWKQGMVAERADYNDRFYEKRAQKLQNQAWGGQKAGNPQMMTRGRFEFGIGRDLPIHRYVPEEEILVWNNPNVLGTYQGNGNEMWGSIADNVARMTKFWDMYEIPFMLQGPRKKQHVAPIRVSVLAEGPFATWDDLPSFAIKLLPPPSGKLNAQALRVVSPDVATRIVPEGSFL